MLLQTGGRTQLGAAAEDEEPPASRSASSSVEASAQSPPSSSQRRRQARGFQREDLTCYGMASSILCWEASPDGPFCTGSGLSRGVWNTRNTLHATSQESGPTVISNSHHLPLQANWMEEFQFWLMKTNVRLNPLLPI